MKKIIPVVLLFGAVNATAQNITVADTVIRFGITEKGKPDGLKAEVKIGKEGGIIQSSDGKVELIFPEGAVTKKTTVSIQPVTNLAPNSNGKAYQMEPSGINFQQPVQIIFHYRDKDTEGSVPDLIGIAMQDDKGRWSSLDKVALDTVFKTIRATISHFSFYVNYLKAKINPSSARVKVNSSLRLQITKIINTEDGNDEIAGLGGDGSDARVLWSVNEIPHGNNVIGLISASQNYSAIFKAPAQVPDQNPVAVSVQNQVRIKGVNHTFRLVSNILIYGDAWEVKMVASIKGGSPQAWGGYVTYNDDGSFIVSLEKKNPVVKGINNTLEQIINNCSKSILNPTTCTGILHVAGTKAIKVTPANPPGQPYPIVEIWFTPYPIELTRYQFTCPPPPGYMHGSSIGKLDLASGGATMLMFFGQPAIPSYLRFAAKDGEQVLMEKGEIGSDIYYKIWVTKLNE